MNVFIADAFTSQPFSGNPAGVALVEHDWPAEADMLRLAAELRHSETAFLRVKGSEVEARYFTPTEEVDLCGHATIASFRVLHGEAGLPAGRYTLHTRAGRLNVDVEERLTWMDMAPPQEGDGFTAAQTAELYAAFGLSTADAAESLAPRVVSTGLADILLPLGSLSALNRAVMDEAAVTALSRQHGAIGFHLFSLGGAEGAAAHTRNFGPLVGIPEEAATGTASGALTHYLAANGLAAPGSELFYVQGEAMGKPSRIYARLPKEGGIRIGGEAAVVLRGEVPSL